VVLSRTEPSRPNLVLYMPVLLELLKAANGWKLDGLSSASGGCSRKRINSIIPSCLLPI